MVSLILKKKKKTATSLIKPLFSVYEEEYKEIVNNGTNQLILYRKDIVAQIEMRILNENLSLCEADDYTRITIRFKR